MADTMKIPCPFVYASGKRCSGHITRVEAYKADVVWELSPGGQWEFGWDPRSHYHLFCSEKGNHAGYKRQDNEQMKCYADQLPVEIQAMLERTGVKQVTHAQATT